MKYVRRLTSNEERSDAGPPHAVVFGTRPIAFAVRDVAAGTDLDAIAQPGQGMGLWLHAPDAQDIHDALAAAGTTIVSAPVDGPFGRTFTFADPDGYQVTLHDRVVGRITPRRPRRATMALSPRSMTIVLAAKPASPWRPYRSLATSYLFSAAFEPESTD